MDESMQKKIQYIIEELLEKMGFPAKVQISHEEEDLENIICNITTTVDSNFLIGQHGINLQAVQHIARLLVRKTTNERVRFILDVNSYRKQKNQTIIEIANQAAEQALNEGRPVFMKPMSTYERRIAHMELAKNERVVTESVGEGESRKVVVKPIGTI
jgi:spoIIIJ-associated protein